MKTQEKDHCMKTICLEDKKMSITLCSMLENCECGNPECCKEAHER